MQMNRRQFLKGLVQVAVVVTSVCLVPDCLPLASPHQPQPIRTRWRIFGATHKSLPHDGDSLEIVELDERLVVTRVAKDILEVERVDSPELIAWQTQINMSRKLGVSSSWFHNGDLDA